MTIVSNANLHKNKSSSLFFLLSVVSYYCIYSNIYRYNSLLPISSIQSIRFGWWYLQHCNGQHCHSTCAGLVTNRARKKRELMARRSEEDESLGVGVTYLVVWTH